MADYSHPETIGAMAILVEAGALAGDILTMGVLFPISNHFDDPKNGFLMAGIIGICIALVIMALTKEVRLRDKHLVKHDTSTISKAFDKDVKSEEELAKRIREKNPI